MKLGAVETIKEIELVRDNTAKVYELVKNRERLAAVVEVRQYLKTNAEEMGIVYHDLTKSDILAVLKKQITTFTDSEDI